MITVQGVGSASGHPELMHVRLIATASRATVAQALAASDAATAAIRAALAEGGVPRSDTATAGLSVTVDHGRQGRGELTAVGYRSEHRLAVVLRDLDRAGALLGAALAAAGDDVALEQVRFAVRDETELIDRARSAAWADAVRRGEQLAELAGRQLGAVETIEEASGGGGPSPRMAMRDVALASAPAPDIEAASITVQVNLTVRWSLS